MSLPLEMQRMHRMQQSWIEPTIRTSFLWLSNPMSPVGWKCTRMALLSLNLQALGHGSLISYHFFPPQIKQSWNAAENSPSSWWRNCLHCQPGVVPFCFSVKCFYRKAHLSRHIRKSNGSFINSILPWLEIMPRCQLFYHASNISSAENVNFLKLPICQTLPPN